MEIQFNDLKAQAKNYEAEIDRAVKDVFSSARFIGGSVVHTLESALSKYTGAEHVICCGCGTDALMISLMALDIGHGDEVITSPFTFIATVGAISLLGAKPVFVDIDEETYNIDASQIEGALTAQTKAIIPISLFGQCADMDTINAIGSKHNIPIIEDGCQSFGARYKENMSCNLSTIGCTSFYPSKPLGCYGDGGAIFTSDDRIAQKIRMLVNHGRNSSDTFTCIGINSRLDAVQAAVLKVKLKYFEEEVSGRRSIGERYTQLLEGAGIVTPTIRTGCESVYSQYSVRVKGRNDVIKRMSDSGVPYAIFYSIPLHLQEAFKNLGHEPGDFPVAETVSREILSLPMSRYLTAAQQDHVVKTVKG